MHVETVSFLKKNAANLPLEEPLIITQNGKPAYVIESIEERDKREEAIALLKLVSFSKSDMQTGRVMSSRSCMDRLAQRKRTIKESQLSKQTKDE